jgi:hypothetical protein
MTDSNDKGTSPDTREPSFEALESDEAKTSSEEAMAPNAVAAAQGGSSMPISGGPAAIIPAAPGDVLNVADDTSEAGARNEKGDVDDGGGDTRLRSED